MILPPKVQSKVQMEPSMPAVSAELSKIQRSVRGVAERLASLGRSFSRTGNQVAANTLFSESNVLSMVMNDLHEVHGVLIDKVVSMADQHSRTTLRIAMGNPPAGDLQFPRAAEAILALAQTAGHKLHVEEDTTSRLMCSLPSSGPSISFSQFRGMWPFSEPKDEEGFCKLCFDRAVERCTRAEKAKSRTEGGDR